MLTRNYNTSTRLRKTDDEPEIGHSNKKVQITTEIYGFRTYKYRPQ